jgi:hypothetical protein
MIELEEQKCEFVFLIDESGSMAGAKSVQVRSAMNVRGHLLFSVSLRSNNADWLSLLSPNNPVFPALTAI